MRIFRDGNIHNSMKMSNKKAKGAVNASSIVDLKAELFRKQEEFKRERYQNQSYIKPKTSKKSNLFSKQNIGVQNRADKDRKLNCDEKDSLAKSRSSLETKAALYDKMARGQLWPEEDEKYMVDFTQKVIDRQQEEKMKQQKEDEEDVTSVPAPSHPEDEWVDYTDSLGRSRRCMKKDLKYLQELDKDLNPATKSSNTAEEPDLLSADMKREMLRKKWEEEEAEAMSKPIGPVHYENVRYEEVRHTGVGYFAFSKEGEARKKQMEQLEMLRDETSDQRVKRGKLKEKRKAAMQARLEKVKQRKKLKGDLFDDDVEEKKEEEVLVELLTRDDTLRQPAMERPWDKGKEKLTTPVRPKPSLPVYSPRDERPSEFAPPTEYYDSGPVKMKNEHRKMWRRKDDVDSTPVNTEQMLPDGSPHVETTVPESTQQFPMTFPPPPPPNFMYPPPPTGQFFPPPGHYPPPAAPVFPQTTSLLHPPPFHDYQQQQWNQQQPQEDRQKPTNVNLDSALSYFRQNAGNSS